MNVNGSQNPNFITAGITPTELEFQKDSLDELLEKYPSIAKDPTPSTTEDTATSEPANQELDPEVAEALLLEVINLTMLPQMMRFMSNFRKSVQEE